MKLINSTKKTRNKLKNIWLKWPPCQKNKNKKCHNSSFQDTYRPALPPCRADLSARCRGPSPAGRRSSAAARRWSPAAPSWVGTSHRQREGVRGPWCLTAVCVCVLRRRCVPDVHEHVAEETPDLRPVAGVIDQGALHEVGLVRLQHPLVQHDPVAHEHDDLQEGNQPSVLADTLGTRADAINRLID